MDDLATDKPGPMGWGVDDSRVDTEKRLAGELEERSPGLLMRRAPKEPLDNELIQKVRDGMAADGMTGGMHLRYIEPIVFGVFLIYLRQLIGSCVASTAFRLGVIRMLWESFALGDAEEIFGTKLIGTNNVAPFAPYHYRSGRMLGGLNGGDGSFCSSQVEGLQKYGFLPCDTPGLVSDAFPEPQSTRTYRQMGNSNSFLEKFAPFGRKHLLNESEPVRDAESAKTLVTEHFKPLAICSMLAFKPSHTHPTWKLADGTPVVIYQRDRSTSWAHSMSIVGIVEVDGKWFVIVLNSWGNAHRNGDWFAIPLETFDVWVRDADCRSYGDIEMTDNVLGA